MSIFHSVHYVFSLGADLENAVNWAAIETLKLGLEKVTHKILKEAINKVMYGLYPWISLVIVILGFVCLSSASSSSSFFDPPLHLFLMIKRVFLMFQKSLFVIHSFFFASCVFLSFLGTLRRNSNAFVQAGEGPREDRIA